METPYFRLSRNEYGKAWLLYKPLKDEPGRYSCWEPITNEFWVEFEKLQAAQEEITSLKAELEKEKELRKELVDSLHALLKYSRRWLDEYTNEIIQSLIKKAKDL